PRHRLITSSPARSGDLTWPEPRIASSRSRSHVTARSTVSGGTNEHTKIIIIRLNVVRPMNSPMPRCSITLAQIITQRQRRVHTRKVKLPSRETLKTMLIHITVSHSQRCFARAFIRPKYGALSIGANDELSITRFIALPDHHVEPSSFDVPLAR